MSAVTTLAVDVSFWCASVAAPWEWAPRLYPGIWAAMAALIVPWVLATRAHRRAVPDERPVRHHGRYFAGGMVVLWLATDWPLGLLGASYLASAHMLQYLMYVLGAAPLLLLGTPEWMARRLLSRLRAYGLASHLARPLTAGIVYNVVLVATHAPVATDLLRANEFGSFLMDAVWLLSGLILWLPILSPLPEHSDRGYGQKMIYLFLAATVVPVFPASFLTFSEFPLYETYELAPRVFDGLTAGDDQAMAGLVMKVGSIPVIWATLLAMMNRWARAEGVPGTTPASRPGPPSVPTPGSA